jgi:hypothetical protein
MDGKLRALASTEGTQTWEVNTAHEYEAVPSKAAGEQHRQECAIAFTLQGLSVGRVPEPL